MIKNLPANAGDVRGGFDPGVGRIPWRRHGNPLQYPWLENPMDRGAWRALVDGVTGSWTRPSARARLQANEESEAATLPAEPPPRGPQSKRESTGPRWGQEENARGLFSSRFSSLLKLSVKNLHLFLNYKNVTDSLDSHFGDKETEAT